MQEEDYSSDTSDEDFTIEGEHAHSEDSEDLTGEDEENAVLQKNIGKKKRKNKKQAIQEYTVEVKSLDEQEEKEKADSLWADFLADVDEKPLEITKQKDSNWSSLLGKKNTSVQSSSHDQNIKNDLGKASSTVKVTKIFEFAGEEVRVEKEVASNSVESIDNNIKDTKKCIGAASIVNFLEQKKKLTTLEKTKLDWDSFKTKEGIEEELEHHKKSKSGYLERKAFLQRADIRQFEIERDMRQNKRIKK